MSWKCLSAICLVVLLHGCGGGGGGGSSSATANGEPAATGNPTSTSTPSPSTTQATSVTVLRGVASAGPLSGASISAYKIINGVQGDLLAGPVVSDGKGAYQLDIGAYSGPLLVIANGGTYTDEATGTVAHLSNSLRSAVGFAQGDMTVSVTPLTEVAVELAEGSGPLTTDSINSAVNLTASQLGFDPVVTLPSDVTSTGSSPLPSAKLYGVYLGVVSQYTNDNRVSLSQAIHDLTTYTEAKALTSNSQIVESLGRFLSNVRNLSGLSTATDVAALSNAMSDWTISDLGAVGHVGSAATGINNLGQITGYVFDKSSQAVAGCSTGSTACYAFKTDANGANLQLLTTGTTYSVAHGINNNGQIVGAQTVGGSGGSIGFVTATNGANYSTLANTRDVIALNDSGQLLISGVSNNPQLYLTGASGAGQVATFAGADIREGVAVNKSGQVLITGWSSISLTGPNGAGLTVLSSIPYTGQQQNFNSFGAGLNNLGQVLGDENDATYRGSFVTGPNGSGLTRVDAGGITVSATAINNNGAIVATGLLIDHGTVVGLNDLPAVKAAGWSYLNPTSINDNGLIVGSGTINGQTHAFLLAPPANANVKP